MKSNSTDSYVKMHNFNQEDNFFSPSSSNRISLSLTSNIKHHEVTVWCFTDRIDERVSEICSRKCFGQSIRVEKHYVSTSPFTMYLIILVIQLYTYLLIADHLVSALKLWYKDKINKTGNAFSRLVLMIIYQQCVYSNPDDKTLKKLSGYEFFNTA